jgi:hypothetical protein
MMKLRITWGIPLRYCAEPFNNDGTFPTFRKYAACPTRGKPKIRLANRMSEYFLPTIFEGSKNSSQRIGNNSENLWKHPGVWPCSFSWQQLPAH